MADRPTCGQGLAEHSSLPATLGELTASVAGHRQTAGELAATGRDMAGQPDLPMGAHDPTVMSSPKAVDAFERFVQAERELLALLQERLRQDEQLLAGMRQGA